MFKNGKPSISMGYLYHGYVTNNQRVSSQISHAASFHLCASPLSPDLRIESNGSASAHVPSGRQYPFEVSGLGGLTGICWASYVMFSKPIRYIYIYIHTYTPLWGFQRSASEGWFSHLSSQFCMFPSFPIIFPSIQGWPFVCRLGAKQPRVGVHPKIAVYSKYVGVPMVLHV